MGRTCDAPRQRDRHWARQRHHGNQGDCLEAGRIPRRRRAQPGPALQSGARPLRQDPEDWWRSGCEALRELLQWVDPDAVAAIAISNQRETFAPLAEDGRSVRPAIVWLDQRCGEEVAWLTGRIGGERFHRLTGKPPDIAPVAFRIAWMLRHEHELFRRTAMFADVHAYLAWRLTGGFRSSWASADPLGLFDMERKAWSQEVLGALDLSEERLPVAVSPGTVIGVVSASAADATSLRSGYPVVAGSGDGQARLVWGSMRLAAIAAT